MGKATLSPLKYHIKWIFHRSPASVLKYILFDILAFFSVQKLSIISYVLMAFRLLEIQPEAARALGDCYSWK